MRSSYFLIILILTVLSCDWTIKSTHQDAIARVNSTFLTKDKIDTGKKLFYVTVAIDLIIALYYLIDVESGLSEDFSYVDLGEIPIFIFILYILFKNSDIKEHNG